MVLRGLYGAYVKNYKDLEIVMDKSTGSFGIEVDNLFLNMGIFMLNRIHMADIYGIKTERQLLSMCMDALDELVDTIKLKKLLYMAFCGLIPMQELVRRRPKRLVRGEQHHRANEKIQSVREKLAEHDVELPKRFCENFDTFAVHFGSDFMDKVVHTLDNHINRRMEKEWKNLMVIVSNHTIPGKPTAKILDFIRSQHYPPDVSNMAFFPENTSLIEALTLNSKNFYVIRRGPRNDGCCVCLAENHQYHQCNATVAWQFLPIKLVPPTDVYSVLDLEVLKDHILNEFRYVKGMDVMEHYIFFAAWFESEPWFQGSFYFAARLLMSCLQMFHKPLVKDRSIIYENLKGFFRCLFESNSKSATDFMSLANMNCSVEEYYQFYYGSVDQGFRIKLTLEFYKSIYWTYDYMVKGLKVDCDYYNTYEFIPHISDIVHLTPESPPIFKHLYSQTNVMSQLFASITPHNFKVLPRQWQPLLRDVHPDISHIFPKIPEDALEYKFKDVPCCDLTDLFKFLEKHFGDLRTTQMKQLRKGKIEVFVDEEHPLCQYIVKCLKSEQENDELEKKWVKTSVKQHGVEGLMSSTSNRAINGQMKLHLSNVDVTDNDTKELMEQFENIKI
ncbi:unnamed protein product [Bursaphelenchus okinawaensis]|uniref:Uncharacterized protein n=1 Tax=Bursaphelenchus okinawaensis TaxID=465554 RepID=A0A811LRQ8_9BILA|nr:unnamed protein product [Bursaphelenchus okinawaensis]CAG9127222.1 unnamed protein product [Bursaphelenchus okinawaensis]